jgi:alkylation response protein AidB-like acyl-CoA dehydrogenase
MTKSLPDTTELEMFRDNVRRYVKEQIAPRHEDWEQGGIIPRDVWRELGEAGLLAVDIPESHGGAGADVAFSMVIHEEMARAGCFALACEMVVHSDIVAHYLLNWGTEEQRRQYLPRLVSGECIGAIAMTEPGAGSDLQSIRANARRDGEAWVINGSKTFITNGQNADLVITAVRTDPAASGSRGTSLFLVDGDAPGFTRGRNLDKIGQHAADTSELFYEDVRVGPGALLGTLNQGFAILMTELPRERLALAVTAVAHAQGALDLTLEYVQQRNAFGQPLARFQNTRFSVAEMATEITVHRYFIEACLAKLRDKKLDTTTASMAKLSCTELQCRVADGCLQLFGGYGYMREYPISRFFVDARVQRIYGGASEIMKEIIGRELCGR